jgi:hypothetical protein
MNLYEEFIQFESWSNEHVRRRVVHPPGTEFTIDMNSELSFPEPEGVVCFVEGTKTLLPGQGRLSFDMNLPDTSDVNIRLEVTNTIVMFEYVFVSMAGESVPAPPPPPPVEYYYRTNKHRNKLFRRTKTSLHTYLSSQNHITLGPRPFSIERLLRYPNITTLKIDVYRQSQFDWQSFQLLLQSMTWLNELVVRFMFHLTDPYIFELFEHLPKKLTIQGKVTLAALDRLEPVRDLMINMSGNYSGIIGPEIGPYLTRLESLHCSFGTLQLNLVELSSLRVLNLDRVLFSYRDCVAIGRLLRRNQLQSLTIQNCDHFKKKELRPIVQPLLEGTCSSLNHLGLIGVHLSKHMIYMLQDVISFCRTLTSMSTSDHPGLNSTADDRMGHFTDLGNIRIARKHVPDGSPLGRVLELTTFDLAMFAQTWRRKNRCWYRTGWREIVCAPFEFL